MKTLFRFFLPALLMLALPAFAQHGKEDKSKRPSPPATVTRKISGGATISINYSQPAVKGRTIGKDLEPYDGKIWRLGANEATVFSTDKALTIDGSPLPAGEYALFCLKNGDVWTLIFNKVWNTWGAYDYEKNKASDVQRVDIRQQTTGSSAERLTFKIAPDGTIQFNWGSYEIRFKAAVAG